eukprot:SAG25_NODE_130_length_14421_cov_71.473886_19_plen_64_part_00
MQDQICQFGRLPPYAEKANSSFRNCYGTYLSDSQAAGLLYNVNISRVLNPNRSRNAQIESSRD